MSGDLCLVIPVIPGNTYDFYLNHTEPLATIEHLELFQDQLIIQ